MAAAVKYRLEAHSRKYNDVYRVDILEEGYAGSITYKNIGAGKIRLEKQEGKIQATSLVVSIQADTDFEYTGFFTYDNFQFPVYLYKNGTKIWSGYMVSESYAEDYKNPPYDVELTATDGLGFLENYTFSNSGTQNYLAAINHCIGNLNLTLDYEVSVDLFETAMSGSETMFAQLYFNGDIFEGEKCSEVIEKLLPFGAVITQKNNRWLIRRPYEDAEKTHTHYLNLGVGLVLHGTDSGETVLNMGDVATGDIWPLGTPLLEMIPAWKDATIKKNYGKRESFLLNHKFILGTDYWTESTSDIVTIVRLGSEYYARMNSYCAIGTNEYIEQQIDITQTTDDDFTFECNYDAIGGTRFTTVSGFASIQLTVRIQVQLGSYYLSTEGWTTTATIMEFPIESSVSSPNWKLLKIITDNVPATGTLSVRLYKIQHETIPARSNTQISGAVFTNIKVYTESLSQVASPEVYTVDLLTNASQSSNTVELEPVSLPDIDNATLMFANGNYLTGDVPTLTWSNNSETGTTIENVVAKQIDAYHGITRHKISGCSWRGANLHLNAVSQHSKNANRKFVADSGTWHVLEDEYDITWQQVAGTGSATPTLDTGSDNGSVHEDSTNSGGGLPTVTVLPNGLLSGGIVTWITGLTFSVSAARYIINNQVYESPDTIITLDAAHATLDRIDVFAVNTNSTAIDITGTPAASPQKPQVDPVTQLELTFITIPAGATEPVDIDVEIIYNENTEWTGSASGTTADFNDTTDPKYGSKDVQVTTIDDGDTITFTAAAAKNFADYTSLNLFVQLKEEMASSEFLLVQFLLSGVAVSTRQNLVLEKDYTGEWQSISTAFSNFDFDSTTFDAVRFSWKNIAGSETHSGFYLDYIQLQKGVNESSSMVLHAPVTIAEGSEPYISISGQELSFDYDLSALASGFDGSYLSLTDTSDSSYSGKDLYVPMVDETNSELDLTPTVLATFDILDDTPSAKTGNAYLHLRVNGDEDAIEYSDKFGDDTNYTEFESDGSMLMVGNATVFDDLVVPLTSSKVGVNSKPDFDETNIGYLFPQNDTSEILYMIVQLPHRWKEGSDVFPHVHYQRTSAGKPTFKIDYSWFSVGDATSAPGTTLTLDTEVVTYSSGSIHQINKSASGISGTGKTISSILLIKLYRDDNTVTGDVLTYQFDIHFEIDRLGSRQEYTK